MTRVHLKCHAPLSVMFMMLPILALLAIDVGAGGGGTGGTCPQEFAINKEVPVFDYKVHFVI